MKKTTLITIALLSLLIVSCSKDDDCGCVPVPGSKQENGDVARGGYLYLNGATVEDCFINENEFEVREMTPEIRERLEQYERDLFESAKNCSARNLIKKAQ